MAIRSNALSFHDRRRRVLRSAGLKLLLSVGICSIGVALFSQVGDLSSPGELQNLIQQQSAAVGSGDLAQIQESSKNLCAFTLRLLAQLKLQESEYPASAKLFEESLSLEGGRPDLRTVYPFAVSLLRSQQKEKAADLFRNAVLQLGDSAPLHIGFGIVYQDAGFLDDAIVEFQRALALDPNVANGHFLLGNAYLGKNMGAYNPDSLREFSAALRQDPSDYRTNLALGTMESQFALYSDAAKHLNVALDGSPGSAEVLLQLGFNAFDQQDYATAKKYLRLALSADKPAEDPRSTVRAYMILSNIAASSGDAQDATALFRQAMKEQHSLPASKLPALPSPSAAGSEHGSTAGHSQNDNSAREPAGGGQMSNPAEERYRDLLGSSFNDWGTAEAQQGKFLDALREFHEAERWNPQTNGLMENIGLAEYKLGDYDEAVRALTVAHAKNSDRAITALLATSLVSAHRYAEAASTFPQLGDSMFSDPAMTYQYAVALARSDQRDSAAKLLAHLEPGAIAKDDDVAVGRLYLDLQDFERALTFFRTALQQNPSTQGAHYGAAIALSHLNQPQEAISEFNLALTENPPSSDAREIHAHLAELYLLSGRKTEAAREKQLSKSGSQ